MPLRGWFDYLRLPWKALPDMQVDIAQLWLATCTAAREIRMSVHETHHPNPSHGLEARVEVLEHANRQLTARFTRMEKNMAATQVDIDALATKLGELQATLSADDAGIQAEIDALKHANPSVDVTGLQAAVDALSAQVDATTALVPATPPAAG